MSIQTKSSLVRSACLEKKAAVRFEERASCCAGRVPQTVYEITEVANWELLRYPLVCVVVLVQGFLSYWKLRNIRLSLVNACPLAGCLGSYRFNLVLIFRFEWIVRKRNITHKKNYLELCQRRYYVMFCIR